MCPGLIPSVCTFVPKDAVVNTEMSSVKCAVNDESVRTPRKSPSTSTNLIHLAISVGKRKVTCIICRKESKGLRPLKSRYARLSIGANRSLVANKRI